MRQTVAWRNRAIPRAPLRSRPRPRPGRGPRADALRIAANVLDSGKTLTAIFISNADPDFYFGAEVLKAQFPQAQVLATAAVRDKIQAKLAGKVAFWGPKMGANAPRKPVLPTALASTTLSLEGQTIEIKGTEGLLAHRPYAWIPSAQAIVGNVGVSLKPTGPLARQFRATILDGG